MKICLVLLALAFSGCVMARENTVRCPDGSECPDSSTCCQIDSGYGCCPLPKAVCCSDKVHCCPNGYTCDTAQGTCNKGTMDSLPWFEHVAPVVRVETVKCPDGSECPDSSTCCQLDSGYGCCPLPKAVCCSDKVHCCPNGYTCDTAQGSCNRGIMDSLPWFEHVAPVVRAQVETVKCPDGSECPDDSTCCQLDSGYGCCPLPKAVCCSDKVHCCPNGYTCDTAQGTCNRGTMDSLPWFEHVAPVVRAQVGTVKCPDGSECPDDSTCCQLDSGYGCCPLPKAVCCSDKVHCCPNGYTCDTAQGTCNRGTMDSLPWFEHVAPVVRAQVETVKCPDGSECPDSSTCCQLDSGYGCCPLPKAVCCSDKVHCCPNGYTCDTSQGTCNRGTMDSLPWFEHVAPVVRAQVETVKCPDGSECPDDSTCCQLDSGYGCCPLPKAICCSDKVHCCPNGYTCDTAQGTCNRGTMDSLPWFEHVAPVVRAQVETVKCPDGSECPDDSTCCQLDSGYGCCPLPKAVCCSDKVHCCPNGYTCDTAQGTCNGGTMGSLPWFEHIPPVNRQ